MDESKRVSSFVWFLYFGPRHILVSLDNIFFSFSPPFSLEMQAVPTAKGQALADEYGIKFFETVSNFLKPYLNFIRSYLLDLYLIHMSTKSI
jgi:hypothetical protein